MTNLGAVPKRLALAVLASLLIFADFQSVNAQRNGAGAANNAANARPALDQGPVDLPPPPPRGAWGEVIFANPRWMVVQNHQGQQFPIAMDAVSQFLIRWPTTVDALTNQSVIEAIGQDVGSNTLRTDHIDVFEGSDRSLVTATYASLLPNNRLVTAVDPGFNRFMNGFDIGAQNLLYGWAYPVSQDEMVNGIPQRLHVVGHVIGVNPVLRVEVVGNNFASVMPMESGAVTITQMTRGDTTFAEKGDLVYLMPTDTTPRTVVLSQVVLYKKIPLRSFRLPVR
jgi:hypothetical protein